MPNFLDDRGADRAGRRADPRATPTPQRPAIATAAIYIAIAVVTIGFVAWALTAIMAH